MFMIRVFDRKLCPRFGLLMYKDKDDKDGCIYQTSFGSFFASKVCSGCTCP